MWPDEQLVMISAVEHYSYCPRQCGLIHVEAVFDENIFTLKRRMAHDRTHDEEQTAWEGGVRIERGLPLWSGRLGLTGKADVVEFHPNGRVYPAEYKHGQKRKHVHDDRQLCAE